MATLVYIFDDGSSETWDIPDGEGRDVIAGIIDRLGLPKTF